MNVAGGERGSDRRKGVRGQTVRLKRHRAWTVLAAVVGLGAVSLAGPGVSAKADAVAAPAAGQAAGQPERLIHWRWGLAASAPTECRFNPTPGAKTPGCFDEDSRLGPDRLPTSGTAGSVYHYVATMTAGYHRFGYTKDGKPMTQMEFLRDFWDVSSCKAESKFWCYPPDGGFELKSGQPIHHTVTLKPGPATKPVYVDRFGLDTGSYLAPAGTSYGKRALPPQSLDTLGNAGPYNYHLYKIVKEFTVDAGPIAPWFGQKGGGLQYITCVTKIFQCPKTLDPKLPNVAELVTEGDLQAQALPLK